MKTPRQVASIIILCILMVAGSGSAQVPRTINYQGSLEQAASGTPVNGTVQITFALYDVQTGGTALWSETHSSVTVDEGIYSVILGTITPLDTLAFEQPYYLELSIGVEVLTPRQPLTSVPYALRSASMDEITVKNGNVGIGTVNPGVKLEVVGGDLELDGDRKLQFSDQYWYLTREANSQSGVSLKMVHYNTTNDGISFGNTANDEQVVINNAGDVGIGTASLRVKLEVVGGDLELDSNRKIRFSDQNWYLTRETNSQSGMSLKMVHYNATNNGISFGNTANDEQVVINNAGDVGIGTASPRVKLEVVGGDLELDSNRKMRFSDQNWYLTREANSQSGMSLKMVHYNTANDGISFGNTANDEQVVINNAGNVGINTTNPQYKLDVAGIIRGNNVSPSDIRWKEDIAPCDDALERITQLQGVTFHWKEPTRGAGPQIGVIAQDIEQVFPELVSTDSEGYKSVAYDRLVAPLIEAVKELKAENDRYRQEITNLKIEQTQQQQELEALQADNRQLKADFERRIAAIEAMINQP